MTDRDEKGRLLPGHKGSNQFSKSDAQPDTPPFDGDFDDAIIFIAETYGRGRPRQTVGLLGVVEDLRRGKPMEFASCLRQAYINRKTRQAANASGGPGVIVNFTTAPSGMYVDAEGKLIEAPDARASWENRSGMNITTDEPPPPAKPALVQPIEDQPPPHDDEDDGTDDGDDMNDLLRSIPKPKFTKPKW